MAQPSKDPELPSLLFKLGLFGLFRLIAGLFTIIMLIGPAAAQNWQDITRTGRGQDQFEMDAAACQMMLAQSPAGQAAEVGTNRVANVLNIVTQVIESQSFSENCMLSRGWKIVAVSNSAPVLQREFAGQTDSDVRVGIFVDIKPDCTTGPLPAVRLATFPAHGAVSLKQGTLKANNFKQCPTMDVPALVTFYHAAKGYSGTDELELEVSFASGQKQLQHIRITVSKTSGVN